VRQPSYSKELAEAVLGLREEYPRWGKDKLAVLLHDKGLPLLGIHGRQDSCTD